MTKTGDGVATPATKPKEDPTKKRKPLKIRCILLFDGKLNNKDNVNARLSNSDEYLKDRMNKDKEQKPAESNYLEEDNYENDFSNIVDLEAGIDLKQNEFDDTVKVYLEGANTTMNPGSAPTSGFSIAAGEEEVKNKVKEGIAEAVFKISKGADSKRIPEQWIIEQLPIDIFGFGRGATTARYCVYELLKIDGDKKQIEKLMIAKGFDVIKTEVCFVGLFDTVPSYVGTRFSSSLRINKIVPADNWLLKLNDIHLAQKAIHLASAEEHRFHFPLININSTVAKGEEYFLPGVHSDIGGGYADKSSDAGLNVFEGSPHLSAKDQRDYLVGHGWYEEEQLIENVLAYTAVDKYQPYSVPKKVRLTVTREFGKTRIVRNAYCKIPLKIMAGFASKSGLTIKLDLNNEATVKIGETGLSDIEARITAYIGKVGARGSKLKDWQITDPELNQLRHQHLHFSSRYNTFFDHQPRRSVFKGNRQRYEFDG